ncbi:hypothetical protein [Bdellovibrio bacteriovorus]|uniref:Uncharacterized protein n=1 Tax=Bdellovibrio bacteriovorus TaxID=959 RepID=A0A150WDS1_BDEBC|nr:hypothetical protein [Bdellovibrio bacteriovorus]KYG61113.1 hypothetical protein AZI85_09160 [Bdellovibrio bacteriovorus]
MKTSLFIGVLLLQLFAFTAEATRRITVTGRGSENSFCNANSGSFCLSNAKNRAEQDAERDARWTCEMSHRGRALSYTAFCSTYCNPNYLPPRHDGTWVNCRSDCRMDCEVQ